MSSPGQRLATRQEAARSPVRWGGIWPGLRPLDDTQTMSRVIVIGDLHGCYDEAIELLDRVAACASDRVVFAGDLVDRGPKRRECVELAMRHESILGNH